MLLNVGQFAYCFDLSAPAADGKLGKELWRYDLFKKNPQPHNMQPQAQPFDPNNPDELVVNYEDGWTLRLGRSAVLQPTYVCPHHAGRPRRPRPDDRRGTLAAVERVGEAQVFGDARHVFLVETTSAGTRSRVLRAIDGSTVEGVKDFAAAFTGPNRVGVLGRNFVLADGADGDPRTLRLYDPLAGTDVWKEEFPAGATVLKTLDPELTGCLLPDGTLDVLDARTGRLLTRAALDKDRLATHLKDPAGGKLSPLLLADAERVYLFLNRSGASNQQYMGYTMIRRVPVNGVAYGFDRATGKRLWFNEGFSSTSRCSWRRSTSCRC